jgi:hypothetical protein
MALGRPSACCACWQACGEDLAAGRQARPGRVFDIHPPADFGVSMIEGMSRAEILESLPEGFCDDCWQQSLDRQKRFSTDPGEDYHWVYYVTHIWDGI